MKHPLELGRLVVTTTVRTHAEYPLLDGARTTGFHHRAVDGQRCELWEAFGWAVRLRRSAGPALIVAWKNARPAAGTPPWRLDDWGPFAMRPGGWSHWSPRRIRWGPRRAPRVMPGAYTDGDSQP